MKDTHKDQDTPLGGQESHLIKAFPPQPTDLHTPDLRADPGRDVSDAGPSHEQGGLGRVSAEAGLVTLERRHVCGGCIPVGTGGQVGGI